MEFKAVDSTKSLTALKWRTNQGAVDDGKNKGEGLKRIPEELKNFTSDGDETVL